MATEDQGIMSLPQGGQPAAQDLTLEDSHDAVMQGLQNASPQASAALQQTMQGLTAQLDQLSDEELDIVLQAIQYLYQGGEKEYAKRLQEILSSGLLDAGDLPEEFDPEILSAIGTVLLQAKRQRQVGNQREEGMQPPAQFARGGIADAARLVASKGRAGDTVLAHINKDEAKLLRKHGGSATINPSTGLVEYSWLSKALRKVGSAVSSVVKSVVNTVKSVVQSPIGKILGTVALATFLGPAGAGITGFNLGAAALPVAAGAVTALGGGNLKQILTSAATAYLAAPGGAVSNFVGGAVNNAAANAALSAGIVGTGAGLLSGQKLSDAVKSGLTAGAISGLATGAQQGFGAQLSLAKAPVPGEMPTTSATGAQGAPLPGGGQLPTPDMTGFEAGPDISAPYSTAARPGATGAQQATTDYGAMAKGEVARLAGNYPSGSSNNLAIGAEAPTGLARIGGGISNLVQGNLGAAYEGIKGGLGDLYNKISPSAIQQEGMANAEVTARKAYDDAIAAGKPESLALKAYDAALKSATPGVLSTYGPMALAGLGAAGAMGGFKPTQPAPSALAEKLKGTPGEDLIRANPKQYLVQGLPGVQYDQSGNIIGSAPWSPSATMEDIRVPAAQRTSAGIAGLGTMYTPPPGVMGLTGQVAQPYNTPSMYTNLMPVGGYPRYAAEGGMIEDDDALHMSLGGAIRRALGYGGPDPQKIQEAQMAQMRAAQAAQAQAQAAAQAQAQAQRVQAAKQAVIPAGQQLAGRTPGQAISPETLSAFAQQFSRNLNINPLYAQGLPARPAVTPQYNAATPYSGLSPAPTGIASLAQGGYPRRTGQISGPGTEKSDSIPAMLSDGEFVMTAKAVRGAGKGDRRAGAKKMYALMHQLERNASRG